MKIPRQLTFVILAFGAACAQAPKTAPASAESPVPQGGKQITAQQACQDPHIQCLDQPIAISLRMADGHAFTETLPPPNPLLQYDRVYLFPGQTLYIEADVKDDTLVNLHMVPANLHPEKTLVLKFEQRETAGEYGMFFSIHQPFMRWLKYHAAIVDADTALGMMKQSSTCPVVPGGEATENWPEPIFEVVVSDFHFLAQDDAKAKHLCIY